MCNVDLLLHPMHQVCLEATCQYPQVLASTGLFLGQSCLLLVGGVAFNGGEFRARGLHLHELSQTLLHVDNPTKFTVLFLSDNSPDTIMEHVSETITVPNLGKGFAILSLKRRQPCKERK